MSKFCTTVTNQLVASLGKIKITFDDGTEVAKDIQTLGDFVFDENSARQPIQIEGLGKSWQIPAVAAAGGAGVPVNYPNGDIGSLTHEVIYIPGSDTGLIKENWGDHPA